jgi:hypothetical protein
MHEPEGSTDLVTLQPVSYNHINNHHWEDLRIGRSEDEPIDAKEAMVSNEDLAERRKGRASGGAGGVACTRLRAKNRGRAKNKQWGKARDLQFHAYWRLERLIEGFRRVSGGQQNW